MISNSDSLIDHVKILMGSMADKANDDMFDQAYLQADRELPWSLPQSDDVKCYWFIERTRRHVIMALCVETSAKFQYKQIHLEHKFKQLMTLVQDMDKAFAQFIEDNPVLFPPSSDAVSEAYRNFKYVKSGFIYDKVGRALT